MTTIADLAREFNVQPHEVAAFADLGKIVSQTEELDADTEALIREAWPQAADIIRADVENRNEDAVLDEVYRITNQAGYDY